MANSLKDKKFPIKITNFINPHLFHFKLDNIIVGQADIDMENGLAEYAKEAQWSHPVGHHPKENDLVCAFIVDWRKWVRAVVDVVFDLTSGTCKQYIVWCLDHGVPMKLGAEHILPMPANFQRFPATAYRGGLAKCVPIEKRFNYRKTEYEIESANRFNDFLNTLAKQLLDEASEILFKPLQKMDDDHIFGDIQIVKHTGYKVDMLKELKKGDGVKIDEHDIPFGIENWETTKTPRYKNDHGQLNVRQLPFKPLTSPKRKKRHHASALSINSTDMDEDKKLVLDWSRQNTILARDMERTIKNQFDTVVDELDVYAMATRQRRERYHTFYNTTSWASNVNQSNSNLGSVYGSRSTITEVQSIAGQSDVTSMMSAPSTTRFFERLNQATKKSTKPASKPSNTPREVFIPSGFERDVLEFHKYNEF